MTEDAIRREGPTASIRAYLGGELSMFGLPDEYELRYGETVLATLQNPAFARDVECVTRDGRWVFRRLRAGNGQARDGTAVIARYRSGFLPGGTIELPDGVELRLRPPGPGQTWKVRRGLRERVLRITATKGPWAIRFDPAAGELYHLPLLTMFAFHSMLGEMGKLSGDGGGAGASGF